MKIYENQQKIIIVGPPVSGKTYLTKKLQQKLKFTKKGLDDIYWDKKFFKKSSKEKRAKKLKSFLEKNKYWILEGVYVGNWLRLAYDEAELIIFLNISRKRITSRLVFKRYLKKKKKLFSIKGWKRIKVIINNIDLIREQIISLINKNNIKKKTITLKSVKEINQFLKSIS